MKYTIKDHKTLSDALKTLRDQQGISQDELSRYAGVSRQTLSEIERSNVDVQISTLLKIVKLLGYQIVIESTGK